MISGRAFLTGGAGFIGRALLKRAYEEHWDASFTVFSRDDSKHAPLMRLYPDVTFIRGDVAGDRDYLTAAMSGHDLVIHAAASKYVDLSETNVMSTVLTNVDGTRNVIEAACRVKSVERVLLLSTDKACVDYHARVEMADGTKRAISALVRERATASVAVIRPDGSIGALPITGWHKNSRAHRDMYGVRYEFGPQHQSSAQRALVTADHRVLTTDGWVAAQHLAGHQLVTSEPAPNNEQEQVVIGTLLGDSSLCGNGRSLRMGQRDSEWLELKAQAVGIRMLATRDASRNGRRFYSATSRASGYISSISMAFGNPKRVPREIVERVFSPRMLAAWFGDDGTTDRGRGNARPLARFATHGFTPDDAEWLARLLTLRGFASHVLTVTAGGKRYPEVRLTADASARLYEVIGAYLPPSLRHKLPTWAAEFDPALWALGPAVPFVAKAIVERVPVQPRDVYCLDVEDAHNFAVAGVVLHNCGPVNTYGMSKAIAERMFWEAGRRDDAPSFVIARYGNVVASTGSVIPKFRALKEAGQPIPVTNPEMTRFYMPYDAALDAIEDALLLAPPGTALIPCELGSMSLMGLVKTAVGEYDNITIAGARPGEKVHEELVNEWELQRCSWMETEHARYYVLTAPGTTMRSGLKVLSSQSARRIEPDLMLEWIEAAELV